MKNFLIFIMINACLVLSATFEIVRDAGESLNDPASKEFAYKDVNGQWCAILKIKTDISDMNFESFGYEKHDYYPEQGLYFVYLQPETKNIRFIKSGFVARNHTFPFKLKSKSVYEMEIRADDLLESKEEIKITVMGDPKDAKLIFDGKELGGNRTVKAFTGKHDLKVIREGYKVYEKKIEVSPEKTMFKYKLEELEDVLATIESEPSGAEVFIDGEKAGVTPLSAFIKEGKRKIRIEKNGYDEIGEELQLTAAGLNKRFILKDTKASVTVKTLKNAAVFINGSMYEKHNEIKLLPGEYKFRAELQSFEPAEMTVVLGVKEKKIIELMPKLISGSIEFDVFPSDVRLVLRDDGGKKLNPTSEKIPNSYINIPIGVYRYRVYKSGYKAQRGQIILRPDVFEKIQAELEPGSDLPEDFVFVEGGEFMMGSNSKEDTNQNPVHKVTVSDFFISKYEVTQEKYEAVADTNPSVFKLENSPVENVSWFDAVKYCNLLSKKEGLQKCYAISGSDVICDWTANGYRLPTEAEWEYAASGGKYKKKYKYSGSDNIDEVAWYEGNQLSTGKTIYKEVGKKKPNDLGIYDMTGNVWEWCWDRYSTYDSHVQNQTDPTGSEAVSGHRRIIRGGCYSYYPSLCTVKYRGENLSESKEMNTGFRVVRIP